MPNFGAYLEDFHEIKLIIPSSFNYKEIYLINSLKEATKVVVKLEEFYGEERSLYCYFPGYFHLREDYNVEVIGENKKITYPLFLGKITRSVRFDHKYGIDANFGVHISGDSTIFRVWAPCSKEVILILNDEEHPLSYIGQGRWEIIFNKNLEGSKYYYKVRVNVEYRKTLDPYGISVSPNFEYNYVLDLANSYQMKYNKEIEAKDPIIYEVEIRDLTKGGTFKAATESFDTNIGMGHIKSLGVTHVEFLPVYTFGGVDEVDKDKYYNWGYNPISYGSISNYLTNDYNNPYGSINEYKELVDNCHKNNLGVIMDVVFNHVYDVENFSINIMNPGYGFHVDSRGFLTNASGCGNDLNSTREMMRKYIIDMITYYVQEFKIDGLRFDLMGLLDVTTLNLIKNKVKEINPNIVLLGEGWNMGVLPVESRGSMNNFYLLKGYSFFNDSFRNLMRGNNDLSYGGFVVGEKIPAHDTFTAFTAYTLNEELWNRPIYSVNYVECHDNYTFYDIMKLKHPEYSDKECIDYTILSLGAVILSQGLPFLHLGQDFLRTKKGIDNSYNLGLDINGIDWERRDQYQEVVESLKELIKLRKKYYFFRLKTVEDISDLVHFEARNTNLTIRYHDEMTNHDYVLIVKNDYEELIKHFPTGNKLIFDGRRTLNKEINNIKLDHPGIYLIEK